MCSLSGADRVIQSWKSKAAKAVFEGRSPKGFPADLLKAARRRLARLNEVTDVEELRVPPGHRLHALIGDRAGQWAISVNDQFRICFVWGADGPQDVEIVDYH